jgi:hypothetical protein
MPEALRAPVKIDQPLAPLPVGGLLAVADVTDTTDEHFMNGVVYESWLCGLGGIAPGLCDVAPGVSVDAAKEFGGSEIVEGYPFAVYTGIECDLFGRPYTEQARGRLAGSEEYLVGRAFQQVLFEVAGPDMPADVCVAGADICDIIGALEQWAGTHYAGRPILHMNRATAAMAISAHQLMPQLDGTLATVQGTPVANSPGYDDDLVFITGPVHLWRTPLNVHDVDAVMENKAKSLAERVYVAAWDCIAASCSVGGA